MGTDADSMVRVIPCDDHSLEFRVGLPLVGGFESKRLVPIITVRESGIPLINEFSLKWNLY
jgi:hypothetical protein